jgi:Flp pilus assembly pilin Flp
MRKLFSKMWQDDAGVVGFEYLLVATIVSLSLVVGLGALSVALNSEFSELTNAILQLNQTYSIQAQSTCVSNNGGSQYTDSSHNVSYGNTSSLNTSFFTFTGPTAACP